MRRPGTFLLGASALVLAACVGEVGDAASAPVASTWRVGDAPRVVIAGASDDSVAPLESVTDVLRLRDGRIVVANGATELRFYTPDGRLAARQGRGGGGPGEYRAVRGLARLPGDSVVVFDGLARRLSVLDPQGRFVRATPVGATGFGLVGLLDDGAAVVGPRARQWVPEGADVEASVYEYDRVPAGGGKAAMVAAVAGPKQFVVQFPDGGRGQLDLPFAAEPHAAIAGGLLLVTSGAVYAVDVHAADGRRVRTITLPHSPAAVRDEDLARWRDARLAELAPWPQQRQRYAASFARMPKPAHFPAIADLVVDDDAQVWVADYAPAPDAPTHWTVFDTAGTVLASATTPAGVRVRRIGADYVLGVARDAMDVERVVLLPLSRR